MESRCRLKILLPGLAMLALGASTAGAQALDLLHSFPGEKGDGQTPTAGPAEGADGVLYGTTFYGGDRLQGTVFRINRDGTEYRRIHDFGYAPDPGEPYGGVIQGSDGWLYGTSIRGGDYVPCPPYGCGTVFRLRTDGADFMVLHTFAGDGEGASPSDSLVEGADGVLYGTTSGAGYSLGSLFRLGKDGTEFMTLHDFGGADGANPNEILEGSDDVLYGMTRTGGRHDRGTVFKINKDGSGFLTLFSFDPFDPEGGFYPTSLIEGSDGALYGTTNGTFDGAVVFKINKDGSGLSTLHYFNDADGLGPNDLIESPAGVLYGSANGGGAHGGGVVFTMHTDGSAFEVLHDFRGRPDDGAGPVGIVRSRSDGALCGTTEYGGDHNHNAGTVFRLALDCQAFIRVLGSAHSPGGDVTVQVHIAHRRPKAVTVPWELSLIDSSGQVVLKRVTEPHTFEPGGVVDRKVQLQLPNDLASETYTLELAISGMAGTKGATTTLQVVRDE